MNERTEVKPNWRIIRDEVIQKYRPNHTNGIQATGGKYMDRYSLVPLEELPLQERQNLGAEWLAYELMLLEKRKRYIQETITGDFKAYLQDHRGVWADERIAVADFGCGNGGMTKFLIDAVSQQEIPSEFLLIDRSPAALHRGWMRFQKEGFHPSAIGGLNDSMVLERQSSPIQTLEFKQRDIADTGLESDSLNAVTSINVLHHLTAEEGIKVADEIHRVLKPGGLFIIEDTAKLPDNLFGRFVLPKIIDKAVSIPTMRKLAAEANVEITDDFLEGARLFIHDAQRAFIQAMTLNQFKEILKESRLGDSLATIRSLKSPKFPWKLLFPSMNYTLGYKK